MRKTSLSLLASLAALALMAAGCTFGPLPGAAKGRLAREQVESAAGPSLPVGPAPDDRYLEALQAASRSSSGSGPVGAITSAVKKGFHKVTGSLAPSTSIQPADDPVSLATASKPSPALYVAMARLWEQSGKVDRAEQQYQRALRMDPRHVGALVGYARLKDRQGALEQATELYEQAAVIGPDQASIFNDLGLCLARRRMFDDSIAALERAVRLEPKEWLYRNNIAMVLVERGRVEEAVSHLQAVRGEAVACYNVAYILQKKGDLEAAKALFARALLKDPSMTNASIWLQRLDEQLASRGRSTPRMAADARRARRPAEAPGPSQRAADFTGRPTPAPVPPRTSIPGAIGGGSSQGGIPVVQPLPPVR